MVDVLGYYLLAKFTNWLLGDVSAAAILPPGTVIKGIGNLVPTEKVV
jgi:hypothetical protein